MSAHEEDSSHAQLGVCGVPVWSFKRTSLFFQATPNLYSFLVDYL